MDLVQGTYANQREKVIHNITELREHIKAAKTDEEREVFEEAMKLEVGALKSVNRRQTQSLRDMSSALVEIDEEAGEDDGTVPTVTFVPVDDADKMASLRSIQ